MKNTHYLLKLFVALLPVITKAQVPTIVSFSPLSATLGSNVVINGTNFSSVSSNNTVFFGATKAIVTGASISSLTVTVPSGATLSQITVKCNNLLAYSSLPFIPTFALCPGADINPDSWLSQINYTTGTREQTGPAIGDIDGDGKPDLLLIVHKGLGPDSLKKDSLYIFRNISTAGVLNASSFAPRVAFSIGGSGTNVVLADIDVDGMLDIVIDSPVPVSNSGFHIFRNQSTPGVINQTSLSPSISFSLTTTGIAHKIVVSDIDGDGKPDIGITKIVQPHVYLKRNLSTPGSITSSSFGADVIYYTLPTFCCARNLKLNDIDNDGKPDMILSSDVSLSVLRNTSTSGAFSFSPPASFSTSLSGISNILFSDLDLDGKGDLIANSGSFFNIFRNTSTSGVINASSLVAPVSYTGAASLIADLDGDGRPDIGGSGTAYKNTSSAGIINSSSFTTSVTLTTGTSDWSHLDNTVGDLDGDGMPDLYYFIAGMNADGIGVKKRNSDVLVPRPDICMVSVDSLSNYNEIYWDKTLYPTMDSMIIYREVTSNTYKRIGAVSNNALSMYIDTARNIGPANGNPNIGTYRYKIKIRDLCGKFSAMSLWHNTVFFINSSGTFFWNEYKIEGSPTPTNPMIQFDLVRDNNAPTGVYTTVGSVAGTQTTLNDPFYPVYQNTADWRVFAYGLNCNAALKTSGTNGIQAQVVKSKSNIRHNYTVSGVNNLSNSTLKVLLYPNPASNLITVELPELKEEITIQIENMLGEIVYSSKGKFSKQTIDMSKFQNGVYSIRLFGNGIQYSNKIVVQR